MADELSQSGFDKTIENLKKDLVKSQKASSEKVGEAIGANSVAIEDMIESTTKSMLFAARQSTEMLHQTLISQFTMSRQLQTQAEDLVADTLTGMLGVAQAAADQAEEADKDEEKTEKKSIFLFTNMKNALGALVNVTTINKLSETERAREEKRASNALLGALGELGDKFSKFKDFASKMLGLATNPLALIGAILGVAAGAVAGLFIKAKQLSGLLNLGEILKTMFAPLKALFGPKTKLGKAVTFVKSLFKPLGSFLKVIGDLIKAFVKGSGTFSKIFKFMKPFFKFGTQLLGKFFIPLTVIIAIFKGIFGFIDELKKGGDVLDASLRAIGDILDFLTFGLLDADALKEFFGKPLREFIEGIKELFTEGFSLATLKKLAGSFIEMWFSAFTIVAKSLGKLLAWVLDKLGFEKTAAAIRDFFAKFNPGKAVREMFDKLIDVVAFIGKAIFDAGSFIVKINVAVVKFFIDLFKGAKDVLLGTGNFIKEVGVAIVSMFKDIIDAVFDFVVGAISDIPLLKHAIPQEVRDAVDRNKEIRAIQKEMGDASLVDAEAELARRQEQQATLAQLKDKEGEILKAIGESGVTPEASKVLMADLIEVKRAIADIPGMALGGIVKTQRLVRISETEAEAVIPLSRLDDLVVNPAIASALMMAEQLATNAGLRNRGRAPTVMAPITNIGSLGGGDSAPSIIPLPLALRNTDDNLQRIMMKDRRALN